MRFVDRRTLLDEKGFTLTEVMVTMLVMIMVLFALYSIFDMSLRVFSFGNDKVEAVENARLGLEKMEREIRAAYAQDKAAGTAAGNALLTSWQPTSISFGNNLNNNYVVDSATEQITYDLSGTTLRRTVGTGTPQPVVEFVKDVDGDGSPLTFSYLDDNGATATSEGTIQMVRIKLEVAVDRGIQEEPVTQTLETDVALKNRGG